MRNASSVIGALIAGLLAGCNGGDTEPLAIHSVSGFVIAAPVSGAVVTAVPLLDTGAPGLPLGSAVTGTDGSFLIEIGAYTGPVAVLAEGGTFVDESTGALLDLPELALAGIGSAVAGDTVVMVTLPTTIAAKRALSLATDPDTGADLAVRNALRMVEEYFGIDGIGTLKPADLTAGAAGAGAASDYGALNAGFSELAAQQRGIPFDVFADMISTDGADGHFDGLLFRRGIEEKIEEAAGGLRLAQSIRDFLDFNTRNQSGLRSGQTAVEETIEGHDDGNGTGAMAHEPRILGMDYTSCALDAGDELRLRGSGFEKGGYEVLFGGTPAEILDASGDGVLVRVPAAAEPRTVDVVVRNQRTGIETVLERDFTYCAAAGTPSVSRVRPDVVPAAGGALLEIEGALFDESVGVEIDGAPASVITRSPERIVVRTPPGDGAASLTLLRNDVAVVQLASAFRYADRDVGIPVATPALAGAWDLYRMGYHKEEDSDGWGAGEFSLALEAGGTGSFTSSETRTGPGYKDTLPFSGATTFRVFPEGSVSFGFDYGADGDEEVGLHAFLAEEGDLFVEGGVDGEKDLELAVGVRRGSGMSDASLKGAWWICQLGHSFVDGGREFLARIGTIEFDGEGGGSFGVREALHGSAGSAGRLASGLASYHVQGDGRFTVDVEEAGFRISGTLLQRGDLAVGLTLDPDEPVSMVLLTPVSHGLPADASFGSWYAGQLMLEYQPGWDAHTYQALRTKVLMDEESHEFGDVQWHWTADRADGTEQGQYFFNGAQPHAPSGLLEAEDGSVFAVLSPTARFMIGLFADLGAGHDVEIDPRLGFGLGVRGLTRYSKYSVEGTYNYAGTVHAYEGENGFGAESAYAFAGQTGFGHDPVAYDGVTHLGSGSVIEPTGRMEKHVRRDTAGNVGVSRMQRPPMTGAYLVLGDGSLYLFQREPTFGLTGITPEPGRLDAVIGTLTPAADVGFARAPAIEWGPTALVAYAKAGAVGSTLAADYGFTELRMGFDGDRSAISSYGIGQMSFYDSGGFGAEGERRVLGETETGRNENALDSGSYGTDLSGRLFTTVGGRPYQGFLSRDLGFGALVEMEDSGWTGDLVLLVRRGGGSRDLTGSLRAAGIARYFEPPDRPNDTESFAADEVLTGSPALVSAGLTGYARSSRTSAADHWIFLARDEEFRAGEYGWIELQVEPDVAWVGWLDPDSRYAILVGDPQHPDGRVLDFLGMVRR